MANVLKKDKQLSILRCLLEGNSIRGTERITGVHRDTIMRTLVRFGNQCEQYLDKALANLPLRHVEVDEIWTFVGKKDKKLNHHERRKGELGSQYLFLALDQDSRLIVSHKIGKRDSSTTFEFIEDLEKRMFRARIACPTCDPKSRRTVGVRTTPQSDRPLMERFVTVS